MRDARSLPTRRRWFLRMASLLGVSLAGWGCHQPPYYYSYYGYGAPACTPVVPAPASPDGKPGGPPTEVVDGAMMSGGTPPRTTTVVGSENQQGVVVGETSGRSRPAWRASNGGDQAVATTSVEGGVRTSSASSDSSVNPQ